MGNRQEIITSGLNHLAHDSLIMPDNKYKIDKEGNIKKISNEGGDEVDMLYDENNNLIDMTFNIQQEFISVSSEITTLFSDTYGHRTYMKGGGGSLYDPSWDMFQVYVGLGELKADIIMIKHGFTLLSKSSLGYKVLGGASKGTLKSSVIAKSIYGDSKINLFNGMVKKLPFISPYKIGMTSYWSSFYGRNATLFGLGRVSIGEILIY